MNYRHAYHAGNFADVVKHIILTRVIAYLQRKEAGLFLLDAHAGVGMYDLQSVEAGKTGEAERGIARLMAARATLPNEAAALMTPYFEALHILTRDGEDYLHSYPGSPALIARTMRRQDRACFNELHPADFASLGHQFAKVRRVELTNIDAATVLRAKLPPSERRALALIDPPFEKVDEFERLSLMIHESLKRFATGTYMIWYPIKKRAEVDTFRAAMEAFAGVDMCDIALQIALLGDDPRFVGTGMIVINPPYVLAQEMAVMLPALVSVLEEEPGSGSWHFRDIGQSIGD